MISIIGSGNVGVSLASLLAQRGLDDITMIDVVPGLARGETLDIAQSNLPKHVTVSGSDEISHIKDSDIVVITSGSTRKEGMTRLDLAEKNTAITREIVSGIRKYVRDAIIIVVTNPVDVMTYVALKISGFPRGRVFGMGALLDSLRFSYFLSQEFGVKRERVKAMVIGEHGEGMVPLKSQSFISGKLVAGMDREKTNRAIERTIHGAEEIIKLKGHTRHAPASAVSMLIESILNDKRDCLPVQAHLEGEYGQKNLCIGVPAVIGRNGIEKIAELDISKNERQMFSQAAEKIKNVASRLNL